MILYKAIKYYILDVCIEKIFNGFLNNLNFGKLNRIYLDELMPGMVLKRIEFAKKIYFDCKILRVSRIPRPPGAYGPDILYLIKFKCSSTNDSIPASNIEIEMALSGNDDIGLYL